MLSNGQEDEECDARDDDSSNAAGKIKLILPVPIKILQLLRHSG